MISKEYKKILTDIHETSPFGKRGKIPHHLSWFINQVNPSSIIDFGCGKGRLVARLQEDYPNISVSGYDPGNLAFDVPLDSRYADMLISTDVLEHVEPEFIDNTLEFLSTKSKYIYHLIALSPAKLILPDGRNAHLILESPEWWRKKFINLGYKIHREDYIEGVKFSKELRRDIEIKKYFIMAER